MILHIFVKIFTYMALHLNENIELPNIEVYSSSAELMPPKFNWGLNIYNYIGLQFYVYHIQWNFDEMKMFDFNNNWDVDFLYEFEHMDVFGMTSREVSDMIIETQMPKTNDLDVIKKWADDNTERVLSKCIKVK